MAAPTPSVSTQPASVGSHPACRSPVMLVAELHACLLPPGRVVCPPSDRRSSGTAAPRRFRRVTSALPQREADRRVTREDSLRALQKNLMGKRRDQRAQGTGERTEPQDAGRRRRAQAAAAARVRNAPHFTSAGLSHRAVANVLAWCNIDRPANHGWVEAAWFSGSPSASAPCAWPPRFSAKISRGPYPTVRDIP